MTQQELTVLNIGQDLDDLMNLDPRGYGVCRILYSASREYTGQPLTTNMAEKLLDSVKKDELVYIITGFVLPPFKKAEMDGIIGSILLARALVKGVGAKPVLICPEDCIYAAEKLATVVGLHFYTSIEEVKEYPISLAAIPFTKDKENVQIEIDKLISKGLPAAVISIEAPGANEKGVYHNAIGLNVTDMEAKADILFETLKNKGVPNFAIGDLGNEIGMGTIGEQLKKYIPRARTISEGDSCQCGCKSGIAAATCADTILTATVSDWGCYGVIAAMALLLKNMEVMHTPELEKEAIFTASNAGMIDMYGWLEPAIDGMDWTINVSIVSLMRSCVENALKLKETCKTWFDKTIELGYFEDN